jgi:O-antigen ligase
MFFKTGMIFFVVALSYWWYNFLHLDADFLDWLSQKINYPTQITGWEHQARMLRYPLGDTLTKDVELYYPASFFINSWSYLYHPTTNSIVLLGSLISASFLYFQKNRICTVTGFGLGLYAAFCLLAILLMQSRIGTVGFLLIVGITGLYYLKRKTKYFKIVCLVSALLAGTVLVLINNRVSSFSSDGVREAYRRIAIGYIHDHLWWGTGFDEQRPALKAQAEEMKDTLPETVYPHSTIEISHVHNQFLGNMVQFGIWGLIALIAMYAAIAYYAVKNRSYLLLTFLAFIFLFMWIEEGEFVLILIFTLFFTAITEAVRQHKNTHR